ncbi:hypothetical protein DU478_14675 [Thalassococcus profundi]|uniref:Magnesium transporter MgtE intracellular domain-containing protein n=1 Tax=Thalassococcus profundi TaxID=2282382 RepID=A0A369TJ87_9RHOB|nr:hypothetical protein [Thalassococcus profundi]RDD65411.1 hypothetical protein DU478_14675 [Thalassococcus profundi]
MKLLSFRKVVILGLGTVAAIKLATVVLPMSAIAETEAGAAQSDIATAAPPPSFAATAPDAAGMCEPSHLIAEAIAEERALLESQREKLADSEARLALAEQSLKAEQARLSEVRDEIETQLDVIQKANGQDMTKLVELYRNMKPQVAAEIMDEMDIETAVQMIGAMQERDAAQIMASLSLVRARAITKIIMERSKLPADRNLAGLKLR